MPRTRGEGHSESRRLRHGCEFASLAVPIANEHIAQEASRPMRRIGASPKESRQIRTSSARDHAIAAHQFDARMERNLMASCANLFPPPPPTPRAHRQAVVAAHRGGFRSLSENSARWVPYARSSDRKCSAAHQLIRCREGVRRANVETTRCSCRNCRRSGLIRARGSSVVKIDPKTARAEFAR